MPRGVLWSSVDSDNVIMRSPSGTEYPLTLLTKDDTDPNGGEISVQLKDPYTLRNPDNGNWSLMTVAAANAVLDLDGEPVAANTVILTQPVNIAAPADTNQPPTITFVRDSAGNTTSPLPEITSVTVWQPTYYLQISDPG